MPPVFHVLLVAADPVLLDRLDEWLRTSAQAPCTRVRCDHAAAAASLLGREEFDLVLFALDPAGADALARLAAAAPATPVLALSARDDEPLALQALRAGAQDVLVLERLNAETMGRICRYAIERARAKAQSETSEQFLRAAVDTLSAHVAILDSQGRIVTVNRAWQAFAAANGMPADTTFAGVDYFSACSGVSGEDAPTAAAAAAGLRAVIAGERDLFELDYPCHSPDEQRWFHLRVTPFGEPAPRRVVVAHENITDRRLAEAAQRRSEGLFEKIFTMAPLGLWLADTRGRILRGNPEGLRIWGLPPDERLDRPGLFRARRLPGGEPVGPADWAIVRSVRQGVTVRDELLEVEAADRTKRYILNYTAPLEDEDGRILGGVIANLDSTARIVAQQQAENALEHIRLILDTSPNCLFIKDRDGRYLLANRATAELFGTTAAALVGSADSEYAASDHWTAAGDGRPGADSDIRSFVAPDGSRRWFRCFTTPISWPDREGCTLTIAVDITEARRAREELRASEEQKRVILDSLDSQVVMLDRGLRVVWANRTAREQVRPDGEPLHCYELISEFRSGPGSGPCADCPAIAAFRTGRTTQVTRKTAAGRTMSLSANPIVDEQGRVNNVVVITTDITERLSLERQLRQAQKMESLGTLAGGIAHDFNNILAALLGYADLARLRLRDHPQVAENLEQVASAGERATDLVRQILTFSRRQDADTVTLRTSISTTVEPVLADPTQVHQIVMNLCVNASHAMEPDGGELFVRIDQLTPDEGFFREHPELSPGPHLRLVVSDTGCGMTPEVMAAIFEPYFTTKGHREGTGLGLAVVHGIVKQYRGEIVVESEPGRGSTFAIYLPVVPRRESPHERGIDRQLGGRGEHILLVDDEPILCKFYQQFLKSQGYRITTCTDPVLALALFEEDPAAFDLVLSDVTMPGMTGDKMGQRMLARRPELPVLLMTGYTKIITGEQARALGFRGLLAKPVPQNDLLATLRRVLTTPAEVEP
jgi:PAS domain S-box-containing protein